MLKPSTSRFTPIAGEIPDVGRAHRQQSRHRPGGQQHSSNSAHQRQHDAFGQQLANQPQAAGTQGRADRNFSGPASRTSQKKVGNVGASDQQHKSHRHQQQQERRPDVTDQIVLHADQADADVLVGIGILLLQAGRDGSHFFARLLQS